jgi:hypothetical protein
VEDRSGHSESSEGIVDHNPFTSAAVIKKKITKNMGQVLIDTIKDAKKKQQDETTKK